MCDYVNEVIDDKASEMVIDEFEEELTLLVDKLLEIGLIKESGVNSGTEFKDLMLFLGKAYSRKNKRIQTSFFKGEVDESFSVNLNNLKKKKIKILLTTFENNIK